jgi:cell volume regulation protein A
MVFGILCFLPFGHCPMILGENTSLAFGVFARFKCRMHIAMNVTSLFGLLGALLVLAFVANRLFQWTRIPDVVVLMATGLLIGPVLGWVRAGQFQDVTHAFGTLALILILFEGGLELNLRETVRHFPGGLLFGILSYALTTALIGWLVAGSLLLPLRSGLLAGAVLGCTSSTIVLPILQQWKTKESVKIILLLEATLGDILGVLTVGFFLQYQQAEGGMLEGFLSSLLLKILISLAVPLLIALLWTHLLPRLSEQRFWHVLTFSLVLLLYAATESLGGSGLLAVLGFGLALSNLRGARESEQPRPFEFFLPGSRPHERTLSFHAELSFLVRTFFFVLIGAIVQLAGLEPIWPLMLGTIGAIYLARWGAVQASRWAWRGLGPVERETILWVLPRGLITIVLALEVVEAQGREMAFLAPLAFAVILLTNLIVVFGSMRIKRGSVPASPGGTPAPETNAGVSPPQTPER